MIINISKINLSGCSGGGGTGSTAVISTKDFSITANGTTNITMNQGVDGISAGTITTNVDLGPAYSSGYTEGFSSGFSSGETEGIAEQKALLTSTTITSNGTVTRENGWSGVTVNVQPTLTAATFDQNGTYTPGSGVDGFNSVTVNVSAGGENRLNKFFNNQVTAITQSDLSGANQIRDYGCYGLSNLKFVDLPSSVATLYGHAFRQSGIETIDVSNVTTYGQSVFSGCTSLTGITGFENYTGDLQNTLFSDCTALTGNLRVGGNITQNTQKVFNNCRSLTAITFLNNLDSCAGRYSSYNPFSGCTGIQYLDYTNCYTIPNLAYTNPFTAFTQNYEIRVPQALYDNWTASTNWSNSAIVSHIVAYPNVHSVGSIKYTTNNGIDVTPNTPYTSTTWDASLISSGFDASTGGTVTMYGLTTIPNNTYSGKTNLETVEIPEGVTRLGAMDRGGVFNACTALTSVVLPSSLMEIGKATFMNCSSLTGITIPSGVTAIGHTAFFNTLLTAMTIPDSVTSIGEQAFQSCTALTSVTLSSELETIESGAFMYCNRLSELTFRGTTPPNISELGTNPFAGVSYSGTIYVPSGYESTYETWIANNSRLSDLTGWTISPIDECAGDPECICTEAGGMWDGENCQPAPEDCAGDPECECLNSGGSWNGESCDYPEPEPEPEPDPGE